jgi:hypothetical protein
VALGLLPQTSAACSGVAQATLHLVQRVAGLAIRRNTSSTSASRPPALNIVSVSSLGDVPAGRINRVSRSAFDVGAGATASIAEARLVERLGMSGPGRSARRITRMPGNCVRQPALERRPDDGGQLDAEIGRL